MPERIQNTPTSIVEAHFLCSFGMAIGNASIDDIVKIQHRSSQSVDVPTLRFSLRFNIDESHL